MENRVITPFNILDIELFCVDIEQQLFCSRIKLKSNDCKFTFQYKTLRSKDPLEIALSLLRKELSLLPTFSCCWITHYNNATFCPFTGSINKNILNKIVRKESL